MKILIIIFKNIKKFKLKKLKKNYFNYHKTQHNSTTRTLSFRLPLLCDVKHQTVNLINQQNIYPQLFCSLNFHQREIDLTSYMRGYDDDNYE